jgi:hypothetical protein
MSNWNKAEVDALREDNGGGNAVNQATFFALLGDGDRAWPTVRHRGPHRREYGERI